MGLSGPNKGGFSSFIEPLKPSNNGFSGITGLFKLKKGGFNSIPKSNSFIGLPRLPKPLRPLDKNSLKKTPKLLRPLRLPNSSF